MEVTGIVTRKIVYGHDWGFLAIAVRQSDHEKFDPITLGQPYFSCYVNGPYAEIYKYTISSEEIGDSIVFSTRSGVIYTFRGGKPVAEDSLLVYTGANEFTEWIKENHKEK